MNMAGIMMRDVDAANIDMTVPCMSEVQNFQTSLYDMLQVFNELKNLCLSTKKSEKRITNKLNYGDI